MSEDCQKCGTAMYDLDEERLCPGCSNHETEIEAMTINQTINGVSRELIEHAIEALTRNLDQHAPMQVPPSKADSDLVREELRALLDSPYPSEAQLIASGLGYPMSKEDAVKAYKASLVPRTDSSSNADCEWCHGCGHDPYGEPCVGCCKPAAEPQDVPVEWGAPKTVRQLVRQLETLDQDLRPLSMLRVPASVFEDGKERVRATHLSFSHERVDGQWLAPFKSDGEKVLAFWCRMEQPAPVAVVLPEREMYCQYLRGVIPDNRLEVEAHKDGWNACLDELERLNPSL